MIDAALLRAIGSDKISDMGAEAGSTDRREACACALAAVKAGEALMDAERFARLLRRLDLRGVGGAAPER